ncbi:hypothetical protein CRG98_025811 [Punica granatum]|uniref:Uncharacterized protein n=1 Tax=Punica granatum TaxID=22663 RepID=A0A2I0JC49_PUNGR|nr:hypothetical protein CRG98_025811 [Punica granatum]
MEEISINIIEKLGQLPPAKPTSYIFKVHHELRAANKELYEPVLLSIGPYYHDKRKSQLQYMEQHKLRYLNDLLKRKEEQGFVTGFYQVRECLGVLEELEDEARGYYADPVALEKNVFLEMLLLDGCFIIELFRKATWKRERETDPLLKAGWVRLSLRRDLMLLENQIPFFVLERLHSMIGDLPGPLYLIRRALRYLPVYGYLRSDVGLLERKNAVQSINNLLSPKSTFGGRRLNREKLRDIKHILDLVRKFMLVEEILEMKAESVSHPQQGQSIKKYILDLVRKFRLVKEILEILQRQRASTESTSVRIKKYKYSATELRDLGVRFNGAKKSKFYDITFENGLLDIPLIQIDDAIEGRFRNLIAYEEHCVGENKYVGDYMSFMDGLVNTPKDVELLRHYGIIESFMGDDEVIATMFNNMCKHRILSSSYYAQIVDKLTKHCSKKRHVWMAMLRRNHLSSPWAILSVLAALILLILTITQTVYTVLSFYNSN